MTKEEIVETINTGIEDFIGRVVDEDCEAAKITVSIRPGEVLISMKKTKSLDDALGVAFN